MQEQHWHHEHELAYAHTLPLMMATVAQMMVTTMAIHTKTAIADNIMLQLHICTTVIIVTIALMFSVLFW